MCIIYNYNIALALFGTLCIKQLRCINSDYYIDMLLSDFAMRDSQELPGMIDGRIMLTVTGCI